MPLAVPPEQPDRLHKLRQIPLRHGIKIHRDETQPQLFSHDVRHQRCYIQNQNVLQVVDAGWQFVMMRKQKKVPTVYKT